MKEKLKKYKQKRNFRKSSEPRGNKANGEHIFAIQKHDAQNLHYDLRLLIDGVLKSWAVPKELSTAANEKRLAIRTEDHPAEYADFEGVIPEDEYGAGTVMIWDKGKFKALSDEGEDSETMMESLKKGALKIHIEGEKLKAGYALVRTSKKEEENEEQWIIFKLDDDYADARRNPVSTQPKSVKSGRTINQIREDESDT